MQISLAEKAWEDYLFWQHSDQKTLKRINAILKDITRHPFHGIGDPEPLKYNWAGYWSRRINREHRLVYTVKEGNIVVAQCKYHY